MDIKNTTKQLLLAKRGEIGEFLSKLIQSLLRIGYYDPKHPESSKIRTGLSDQFNHFFANRYDLTFLIQNADTGKEVILMGIIDEPVRMHDLIPGANAQVFSSKLTEFMSRKNLVSLTLKREITEEEFMNFVEILSKTTLEDIHDIQESMDRFTQLLSERSIAHVSYLFDQDVVGCDRNLHWQVWLTISRFKKDIRIIPILQKLTPEEFLAVRKQLIKDVVRPIAKPALLAEFLMNADLLATEEMTLQEIEKEIIDDIPVSMVAGSCEGLLTYICTGGEGASDTRKIEEDSRARSIIRRLCFQIPKDDESEETLGLLKKLYEKKIFGIEELPKHLQLRLKTEKILNKFLETPDGVITFFHSIQAQATYDQYKQIFRLIIPELMKMGRYHEIEIILNALNRHHAEQTDRSMWASQALGEIIPSITAHKIHQSYISADKPKRMEMNKMILELGTTGKDILLEVITSSKDQWVIKNACDALASFGPDAISSLISKFKKGSIPESSLKAILAGFEDICKGMQNTDLASQELLDFLKGYLKHHDPRVREEALALLGHLGSVKVENEVIGALKDHDGRVRRKAVWCARMLRSQKAIPHLFDILMLETGNEEIEILQKEVCIAFSHLGNMQYDGNKRMEDVLFKALRRHRGSLLTRFFRMRFGRSKGIVAAICATLGAIGTSRSFKALEAMARSKPDIIRDEAQKALNAIKDRESTNSTGSQETLKPPQAIPSLS